LKFIARTKNYSLTEQYSGGGQNQVGLHKLIKASTTRHKTKTRGFSGKHQTILPRLLPGDFLPFWWRLLEERTKLIVERFFAEAQKFGMVLYQRCAICFV
jgi:hypothetical protein